MGILEDIRNYKPYNEREEKDKEIILYCLENEPNIFKRDNKLVHMTSSAWITNRDHTKILMAYHNIYKSFSWLGGHSDGNENCLENEPNIFKRDNKLVHMTSSAWITNRDHTKILMAYHNIYKSFSWLGGHSDGNEDCLEVAIKEAKEESGINNIKAISNDIFSIEVLTVDGHIKKGEYVSSHIHLNVTYLLEADDTDILKVKEDENSAVKWFLKDEAVMASNEPWFRENVYSKLNKKMEEFYENN